MSIYTLPHSPLALSVLRAFGSLVDVRGPCISNAKQQRRLHCACMVLARPLPSAKQCRKFDPSVVFPRRPSARILDTTCARNHLINDRGKAAGCLSAIALESNLPHLLKRRTLRCAPPSSRSNPIGPPCTSPACVSRALVHFQRRGHQSSNRTKTRSHRTRPRLAYKGTSHFARLCFASSLTRCYSRPVVATS